MMKRRAERRPAIAGMVAGLFLAALAAPGMAATVTVPQGTRVPLTFAQRLSTRGAHRGDRVRLRVSRDVMVDGVRVIRRGARATGHVAEVQQPKRFGRQGQIKISLDGVRGADGSLIPLGRYESGTRVRAGGAAASGAGLIVLGPIGLAAGALVKGKDLTIKPGTAIDGSVSGNPQVRVASH